MDIDAISTVEIKEYFFSKDNYFRAPKINSEPKI